MRVTKSIVIDEQELEEEFIRSPGPGGQNVNKVATGVQLRFDVASSRSLPEQVKVRLRGLAGNRMNAQGALIISAHRYRSQDRNRQDARQRLAELIRKATRKPRPRIPTKPSKAVRERRLEKKKRHSMKKRQRREPF
jgi:ribosome-associated protein